MALALVAGTTPSGASEVAPVQKVLDMLGQMKVKAATARQQEQKVFAEYQEWADDRATELGFEIKTGESEIEKLVAFIEQADNTVATLGEEIAELESEIAGFQADQKAATEQRRIEHEEYMNASQDYAESVDALEQAIQVLKQQAYSRPQAELLLQQMAKTKPGLHRVIAALLEEQSSNHGAPAVAAYEFQSDNIIEILENLHDKFKGDLSETEREEGNRNHAYDLSMLHLSNSLAQTEADRNEKAAVRAKKAAASADAKGQLADTRTGLAEDQKDLANTKSTLAAKTAAFESNQKIRAEEIDAIGQAIEIISNPTVASAYSTHIKSLVQVAVPVRPAGLSLLQTGMRTASERAIAKIQAAAFLKERAATLNSDVLAKAADSVANNPFAKVIEMIKNLLAKLKEEAASEATHKAWCDDELKKNKLKREKKGAKVDQLTASITQMAGQIQTMAADIATLAKEQAELSKAMAEAISIRQKEHDENVGTISDSQAAQEAVQQALVILREFYSKQEGFLQQGAQQVPALEPYKGLQGSKGGVIGMLEVIESDFARLESETKAAEAQAASEFEAFMSDSKASKKEKHDHEFKLSLEKDQKEFEKGRANDELEVTQEELDASNAYFADLKPACLEVHVSYEERVRHREEELAALRQAYEILDGMSAA